VVALLEEFAGTLVTTWPVVAEACALVGERRQREVLQWVDDPEVTLYSIDDGLKFMRTQLDRYADLPCDFTDASLLYAAVRSGVREIWTLDSDFLVYRLPDKTHFTVVPGGRE
jgi:predicted nucleic acid-binding protein